MEFIWNSHLYILGSAHCCSGLALQAHGGLDAENSFSGSHLPVWESMACNLQVNLEICWVDGFVFFSYLSPSSFKALSVQGRHCESKLLKPWTLDTLNRSWWILRSSSVQKLGAQFLTYILTIGNLSQVHSGICCSGLVLNFFAICSFKLSPEGST